MLLLSVCRLAWLPRTTMPLHQLLLVVVVAVLFAGCAVNPVPTPSKTGGNQYEGKDADASLVAHDAVSGAADVSATQADTGADGAQVDSAMTDTLAGD